MDPDIRIMPEGFGGLEYKDVSNIHPVGLAVVLILGMAMLFLPRRWAVLPMLCIACFVPMVQKIVILELDFNFLRIMVVFGVMRLLLKNEYLSYTWIPLDTVIILWAISAILIHTLQQGTFSALVNRLGFGFDAFGMYFLFRCLIRDWIDVDRIVLGFMLISVPVAAFFLLENRTGRNVFSVFGGVPEITVVRYGRLRCQGAFSHAILAGCFWASLIPLFTARWWKSAKDRVSRHLNDYCVLLCFQYAGYGRYCRYDWRCDVFPSLPDAAGSLGNSVDPYCPAYCYECTGLAPDLPNQRRRRVHGLFSLSLDQWGNRTFW